MRFWEVGFGRVMSVDQGRRQMCELRRPGKSSRRQWKRDSAAIRTAEGRHAWGRNRAEVKAC